MNLYTLACLAFGALAPLSAQDPPFRLVPRAAEALVPGGPAWHDSFAAAEAAAKQQHTHLLLYFTARWCGPCKRMERETFPDPEVRAALAGIALARLDIDAAANVEVCRRLHGHEGVPTFVLLDPAGAELHRWVGGGEAARFLLELRAGIAGGAKAAQGALEHHAALAEFYLRRNDLDQAAEQLRAIERLDPEHRSAALENALWAACSSARQRRDWAGLRSAAQRYLALPGAARADQVRPLLGIAEFETTGTLTPELQGYVDARIAVIATPGPGSSLGDRVGRLLGKEPDRTGGAEWADRCNAATHELVDVGRAAAPSLREALLHKPNATFRSAIVLAQLRLPESTPWLIERLADPATPAWSRRSIVMAISMHKEERCLPALLACLGGRQPAAVQAEAVDGIRELIFKSGGTTRQDIADALAQALESREVRLIGNVLQALNYVHRPMSLERLLDLLDDERSLGWGDYRICDNALWILLDQIGMGLQRSNGTWASDHCSREIATWLREWHKGAAASLRWDSDAKCYRAAVR